MFTGLVQATHPGTVGPPEKAACGSSPLLWFEGLHQFRRIAYKAHGLVLIVRSPFDTRSSDRNPLPSKLLIEVFPLRRRSGRL
jgi:hypothetical protein